MDNQKKIPNRLINEKSPYLLQHAYNPADWYPWERKHLAKQKPRIIRFFFQSAIPAVIGAMFAKVTTQLIILSNFIVIYS